MTGITVERIGRRSYLRGNTYPIKDMLKGAGAHWDGDQRAWWIGDHGKAEELAAKGAGGTQGGGDERGHGGDKLTADSKIAGKARYQGREYLLLWEGPTRKGFAAKLAFSDGSKIFWASQGEYQVTKRYEERTEGHGRYQRTRGGMTFGRLQELREEFAAERKQERALGAKDGLVGERSELAASFDASKHDKTPGREIGHVQWLRHQGQRIAVVLVGYELAGYVSSETAEDMGHDDRRSGWYGMMFFRPATEAEYEQLQARDPRADGAYLRNGVAVTPAVAMGIDAVTRRDIAEIMSEDN